MQRFLSPKELAQAIGVSESSLKRWADEGLLVVSRTAGGHRRIALREAVRYIRSAGLPILKPELLGLPDLAAAPALPDDPAAADRALVAALANGHAEIARGIALSLYLAGRPIAELCDGPLAGALHQVGDLWRHGPEGIYIEHRAVDIATQCLHQLRTILPLPAPHAPIALGGALEGDPYTLPTLMVALVLAAAGWRAVNLGPNLPMAALLSAVRENRPALVWLSCSVEEAATDHAAEIRKTLHDLSRKNLDIIAGGRAWNARQLGAAERLTFVGSMAEVAAFVKGLHAAHVSP